MPNQLQNEVVVLAKVRRLISAGLAGNDVSQPMASLIDETSRLPLRNLDAWESAIRTEIWETEGTFFRDTRSLWRRRTARFPSWLDLCSGDGFRRERILRALTEGAPNGLFFSLAMRRLNDWVPQVRSAARERLPMIARRSDPEVVVDGLWTMLPHCSSWGRMKHADAQVLADLISIDRVTQVLKSRITHATAGPAPLILAQAGRSPALDQWLGEIAATAVQPSVRARAYRYLLEGRVVWVVGRRWTWTDVKWCKQRLEPVLEERFISVNEPFWRILEEASVDRSARVRRVAADLLIQQLGAIGGDAAAMAERLASDPHQSVAERGRFLVSKLADRE